MHLGQVTQKEKPCRGGSHSLLQHRRSSKPTLAVSGQVTGECATITITFAPSLPNGASESHLPAYACLDLQPLLLLVILGEGPQYHPPSKASKVFSFPRSSFLPSALFLFLSRVTPGLRPGPCSFPSLLSSSQYLNIKSSLWALFRATKSASTTAVGSLWQTHQCGALPGAPR